MRDDIDFDLVDKQTKVLLGGYQWQTENEAIRFSFNLALDSLKDHEIDRCVWTLKKAVETSVDGDGIANAVYELLIQASLFQEAIEVLGEAIDKKFEDPYFGFHYARCLYETNEYDEAETYLAIQLEEDEDKFSYLSLGLLALIRNSQGRHIEAKALGQEAFLSLIRLGLPRNASLYWNYSLHCEQLNLIEEAIHAAKSGQLTDPLFGDWDARILELENLSNQSGDEDETDLEDSSLEIETYEEWFKAGSFWHTNIPKDFFSGTLEFLEGRYSYDANWSDQSSYLFNYSLDDEGLEESLARVESLSSHIHLQSTWPIYLETPDISIAMTLNQNYLLAWVVNIKTWDLYHTDDPDARFAVGAVLNWFLDCSLNILNHEMFISIPYKWREVDRPWEPDLTTWSTTSAFTQDIENMRRFTDRTPPRAHRVRGHIRTLTERQPTDEARENAPAYIRRNMSPSDTFVRSYTKSGDVGTDKLLVHLNTKSSLADFLATAPLLGD
jgi:tetratricopeptide (TPR) repeat protein